MRAHLLRLSVEAGHHGARKLDPVDQAMMQIAVQSRVIEQLTPTQRWTWLADGLMTPRPSEFLIALRRCDGLLGLLPEVEALFGVPQLSDARAPVDVGAHQLRLLDALAAVSAPLVVRFAALMHKIGKGCTPREIWPSHYKHEHRAHTLLAAIRARLAVPPDAFSLAQLAIDECDRVHRASDMRAGAIAALLQRVRAAEDTARFEQLLCVCTYGYAAYEGHSAAEYPKATRLRAALAAYVQPAVDSLSGGEAALEARAEAIARGLGSLA